MHADGGKQFRVGVAQDGGHRATGRQPGDIDPAGVDRVTGHHVAHHGREQRGFAASTLLMAVLEPVPAALWIGRQRLRRVQHDQTLITREGIHAGAHSEVVRVLTAAVQHHHQGLRQVFRVRWQVEFVVTPVQPLFGLLETAGNELALGMIVRAVAAHRGLQGRESALHALHQIVQGMGLA